MDDIIYNSINIYYGDIRLKKHKKRNHGTRLREDIEFVFQQITVFNKTLPQKGDDAPFTPHTQQSGSLPHPNGGWVTCGHAAGQRMLKIVEDHWPKIKEGNQIEMYSVFDAFRKERWPRFFGQGSKL